jgi:hypothetical protein
MKFKIHYTAKGQEDSYVIEGDNIKEVKRINEAEMEKRELDLQGNSVWAENLAKSPLRNY